MLAWRWHYTTGYVRGFVTGLREYRQTPCAGAVAPTVEDDPDILLAQAQTEMRENQAKNRERAVQAVTAKNYLQASIIQVENTVSSLEAKADKATQDGDGTLAGQLLAERDVYRTTLTKLHVSLASANETVERVKVAIRREEERIRARTAQAMALKAQWNQHQIFASIEAARASDHEEELRPLRTEIKAVLAIIRRTDADLQEQAAQAMRDGDLDLAQAIMTERAALRNPLSV